MQEMQSRKDPHGRFRALGPVAASLLLAAAAGGTVALAGPVPDYGLDWVTVADPGNRPTRTDEVISDPDLEIGAVDYAFRLTRTNLDNIRILEFVRAYAPY